MPAEPTETFRYEDVPETFSYENVQEFVDEGITDPAVLAALAKQSRHRKWRLPQRGWWWITIGAVIAALLVGILLGRWLFGNAG
jgi:hypothetical protein